MRPLTPFASYHDNAGLLLVGRVRFCNLDSSSAEVFAEDGTTSLGSSVFTDSSGRLVHQPFLADHDYIIYFDKYVGEATMTEDDDSESWEEQGSAIDRYNTIGIETDGETVIPIATINALRHTDPETVSEFEGVRVANLLGYYVVGDKPSIYYVWNPTLTDADDGGSVIKVADIATGRWVLKECPVRLDVRHFGAFPESSDSAHLTQRYAIQKADSFARSHGCGIYFHADAFSVFYDITGLTIHDVDCNPAARLYSTDTKAYIVGIEKVYLGGTSNGYVELVAPTVRTSWANGYVWVVFTPSERLVVDAAIPAGVTHNFSGIIVEMNVYCGQNASFDNCEMVSRGAITGQMVLENMAVKTEWFPDDYDWANLTMTGCTVLLRNCRDADTYILLKNKIHEADYGDLGEQTVTGATLLAGCVAENAYFVNVTIRGATELHNVTGTVLTDANSLPQINAVDCWLTFADASDFTVTGLTLNRGAISASNKMFVTAENPTSAAPIVVTIKDAEINCEMEVSYAQLHLERNVVNDDILHVGQMNSISEVIVGNTFNAQLKISNFQETGLPPAGVVHAMWKDNIGNVSDPLVIDHAKIKTTDSEHSYVYENNTGSFLHGIKDEISVLNRTLISLREAHGDLPSAQDVAEKIFLYQYDLNGSPSYNDVGAPIVAFVHSFSFDIPIFRIGTDSFNAIVDWSILSEQSTGFPFTMCIAPSPFSVNVFYDANSDGWNMACSNQNIAFAGTKYFAKTVSAFDPFDEYKYVNFKIKPL